MSISLPELNELCQSEAVPPRLRNLYSIWILKAQRAKEGWTDEQFKDALLALPASARQVLYEQAWVYFAGMLVAVLEAAHEVLDLPPEGFTPIADPSGDNFTWHQMQRWCQGIVFTAEAWSALVEGEMPPHVWEELNREHGSMVYDPDDPPAGEPEPVPVVVQAPAPPAKQKPYWLA